jgi:hypothetical protein
MFEKTRLYIAPVAFPVMKYSPRRLFLRTAQEASLSVNSKLFNHSQHLHCDKYFAIINHFSQKKKKKQAGKYLFISLIISFE